MGLEMVLNDLSFGSPASDEFLARQRMSDLVQTIRAATMLGADRVVRTEELFQHMTLAPNYRVVQWRNDQRVDRDERRFFSSLLQKAPYLSDDDDLGRFMDQLRFEFKFGEDVAAGLGAAFVLDALALSICSDPRWDADQLQIELGELTDSDTVHVESVVVPHACRPTHVEKHQPWIAIRLLSEVKDGMDLWERRASLFPSLAWCDSIVESLRGLSSGNPLLRQIVRRLMELDNHCRTWTAGPFDPERLGKATIDSNATIQQYSNERMFRCPDGETRLFSWHLRLTPNAWRLYFLPTPRTETQLTIVGYIGPHLPTVKEPT